MSISEQAKELRDGSDIYKVGGFPEVSKLLKNAADTIEVLSTKMADMERSVEDCGGGWIPCKERLPDKKGDYWITYTYESYKHLRKCVGVSAFIDGKFTKCGINIIAWKPCDTPEPYHEP